MARRPPADLTPRWSWPVLLLCAGTGLAAGLVYALTAAHDIVVGDTAELMAAALTRGVAHAPGYPLLTMLGAAFSALPFGAEGFRVSLVAVLSGAWAVGMTTATAYQLTHSRLAALLAGAVLAINPLVWTWSVVFEAFPLANAIIATLVFLLVRWHQEPHRTGWLIAAAGVTGLALTNHMTVVLLGPAILFLLWRHREVLTRRPRVVALCALALAVGLTPYVYIPVAAAADPYINTGNVDSAGALWRLVSRADYGSSQLVAEAANAGGSPVDRIAALFASFTLPEGILLLVGAAALWQRQRNILTFLLLAFVVAGPAFVAYANLDLGQTFGLFVLQRFFLLPHILVAPIAAAGIARLVELAGATVQRRQFAGAGLAALVAVYCTATVYTHHDEVDQSHNRVARHFAEDILASVDPNTVLMVSADDTAFPLMYLQAVERARPDVTLIALPALNGPAWYSEQLRRRDPRLVLPGGSLKALLDANRGRPFAVIGRVADTSLAGSYYGFPRGLVTVIEPVEAARTIADMVTEYDRLAARYRVPSHATIKAGTFETGIVRAYAAPAFIVGTELARAGDPARGRAYVERALAIDPSFTEARTALNQLR